MYTVAFVRCVCCITVCMCSSPPPHNNNPMCMPVCTLPTAHHPALPHVCLKHPPHYVQASQAMVDNGGVAALVALATHPQEEHHVLALSTLRTLACARHMHNKIVFASQGALALMVRMLGSSKEALVQEAMLGLAELSADAKVWGGWGVGGVHMAMLVCLCSVCVCVVLQI